MIEREKSVVANWYLNEKYLKCHSEALFAEESLNVKILINKMVPSEIPCGGVYPELAERLFRMTKN